MRFDSRSRRPCDPLGGDSRGSADPKRKRGVGDEVTSLIEGLGFEIVPVTAASARGAARAYVRWGRGVHPAGLNLGDCFAYEVAQAYRCPLLFVGNDLARTDIESAL